MSPLSSHEVTYFLELKAKPPIVYKCSFPLVNSSSDYGFPGCQDMNKDLSPFLG